MTRKSPTLVGASLIFMATSAFAATTPSWLDNVEVSTSLGRSWLQSDNGTLTIDSQTTDSDHVNSVANNVAWKIGVGYSLFKEQLSQRTYFNALLVELNLYQNSGSLTGDVLINDQPGVIDYTFRAPVTSTRLMIDLKPSLLTWHGISPYPILGLGVAWNKIAYYETASSPSGTPYTLNASTSSQFASEVGFGIRTKINEHLNATLEYLYANLGNATPSGTSSTYENPQSPSTFGLRDQSLSAGLNWDFG